MALAVDPAPMAAAAAVGRFAVVDVGSNSIRLVVFGRVSRVPEAIFNERVMCGLGRGIGGSGQLNADAIEPALSTLSRFATLARALQAETVDAVATAAVRDAADGEAFVAEAKRRAGLTIRILRGEEEAYLSALGVVSAMPDADGLMADLGGGSLELVSLNAGAPGQYATLPIGPLRLGPAANTDTSPPDESVEDHLAQVAWLAEAAGRSLVLVGGAWRSLARIHAAEAHYPLPIVHHYRLARDVAEQLCAEIAASGADALRRRLALPRKRLETVPSGARVLARLLAEARPREVIFSAYGLREGLAYDRLSPATRAEDPLISACADWAAYDGRPAAYGEALFAWTEGAFGGRVSDDSRLRHAACMLSDIVWRDHPDYRAEHAYQQVMRRPLIGVDHLGRAFLALVVAKRYGAAPDAPFLTAPHILLSEDRATVARALGLALRLGNGLSAGEPEILGQSVLRATAGGSLTLSLHPDFEALVTRKVERELGALAGALSLKPAVVLGAVASVPT